MIGVPKQWRVRFLVSTVAAGITACDSPEPHDQLGGDVGHGSSVTIRDSADIEVIENHAPLVDPAEFWRLEAAPEFTIGGFSDVSDSGEGSHLVWDVRAAALLSDGRVAMLSPRGEEKVLIFEPSGRLSESFGRTGRGPGEFLHPQDLQVLPGDTIVIWDRMFGSVGYFDASGTLLRHRSIDLGAVIAATQTPSQIPDESMRQPLPDGSFIVGIRPHDWQRPTAGTLYREPRAYVRIAPDYSAHSFGWWKGPQEVAPYDPMIPFLPFPVASLVAGGGNPVSVFLTNADTYEVHQFSVEGELHRIIRRDFYASPITSNEIADWERRFIVSSQMVDHGDWEQAMAALPRRFHRPIAGMKVDSGGFLWVQDGRGPDATPAWSAFDRDGRWLGTLAIPVERVLWIGNDLVIGLRFHPETGVQTVEGYRLKRDVGAL